MLQDNRGLTRATLQENGIKEYQIITVRTPLSLHSKLLDERYEVKMSMNKLCLERLDTPLEFWEALLNVDWNKLARQVNGDEKLVSKLKVFEAVAEKIYRSRENAKRK